MFRTCKTKWVMTYFQCSREIRNAVIQLYSSVSFIWITSSIFVLSIGPSLFFLSPHLSLYFYPLLLSFLFSYLFFFFFKFLKISPGISGDYPEKGPKMVKVILWLWLVNLSRNTYRVRRGLQQIFRRILGDGLVNAPRPQDKSLKHFRSILKHLMESNRSLLVECFEKAQRPPGETLKKVQKNYGLCLETLRGFQVSRELSKVIHVCKKTSSSLLILHPDTTKFVSRYTTQEIQCLNSSSYLLSQCQG